MTSPMRRHPRAGSHTAKIRRNLGSTIRLMERVLSLPLLRRKSMQRGSGKIEGEGLINYSLSVNSNASDSV